MTGEIKSFRKQLFGGFDRKEVMGYIAQLSQERNVLGKAKLEAESALSKLADEIERLNSELEEANAAAAKGREDGQAAFEAAMLAFEDLKTEFGQVHKDITDAFARANGELVSAAVPMKELPGVIEKTEEKLRGMQAAFVSGGAQTDEPAPEPDGTERDDDGKLISMFGHDEEDAEAAEGWQ